MGITNGVIYHETSLCPLSEAWEHGTGKKQKIKQKSIIPFLAT
jgi:hypothetical protein